MMGAIFPMAPLATRMGFVRKREKDARRYAQQAQRDCVPSLTRARIATGVPQQADSS